MSLLVGRSIRDSPLARRDPTVKLGVLFVVSLALLFVLDPVVPAVVYLAGLVGVAVGGRIPGRTLLAAHLPFAGFALGVLLVNVLSRPGTVLWQEGPLRVTSEGLVVGLALAARTLAVGILAIGFVLTTDSLALMTSLHQNARLPARPSYALMAGYRLLQQLPAEWSVIRDAQRMRVRTHRPTGGLGAFGRAAFTLLVVAIRRGERMAQSLESRGLGLSPRTIWRPAPITGVDVAFAVVVLGVLGALLAVAAALGLLAGPGSLF